MKQIIVYLCFFLIFSKTALGAECTLSKNSLSDSDKDKLLAKHNELRNKLASGQQTGQPAAKNIEEMVWDLELAELAQKYANTCPSGHNSNRKTKSYSQSGENLYWSMSSVEEAVDYSQAAQSWYDEVKDFNDKSLIAKFASNSNFHKIGHYTQVIWHDSNKVGCGVNSYKDDSWFKTVVVCNYYKPGNLVGSAIYDQGTTATGCKTKSSKYSSLCANGAVSGSTAGGGSGSGSGGGGNSEGSGSENTKENAKEDTGKNSQEKEAGKSSNENNENAEGSSQSKNKNVNPNIPPPQSEEENGTTTDIGKTDEMTFLKNLKKKFKLRQDALQTFMNNVSCKKLLRPIIQL